MTPKRLFTVFATAEGFTWATLLIALAVRTQAPLDPMALTIVGGIHGAIFLGYAVSAALVGVNQRWSAGSIALGISLALVPFATIPFELNRKKRAMLDGEWRREVSNHLRDASWFDRLFRWFINRPALLILALLTVLVAIFSGLLWLGPPDQWGK